ncbi:hypothetical protein H0S70_01410 [Chryseobacterium manosquense]|uniref:Uncharacterized protein n=1 Tax=Chryseobacterium manosquense TaxID=2754694 RepID=A0A7H1DXH1_9FLAO|nr:hypothetical protein [Chryseobacterium manosquense]QNS41679.1 hypothetical protein H0S70_01410 [Chryseobacterium manosquense]
MSENLKYYLANKFLSASEKSITEDSFWDENNNVHSKSIEFLKLCFPQLCFKIEKGIDDSQLYRDATLKGKFEDVKGEKNCLKLNDKDNIQLYLYKSFAGNIPIIVIPDECDFVKITQALLHRNSPKEIPMSMGACLINGINNWKKIKFLKNKWQNKSISSHTWSQEFKQYILPNPSLYKDKLILLSEKKYSGVESIAVDLAAKDWLDISFKIRLEHECTHLFTLNHFGIASNNLHDELIADYVGITKAIGSFNKEWMLLFLGLEQFPNYRKGARLENYIENLNFEDFSNLKNIIKNAVENISLFDLEIGRYNSCDEELIKRIKTLCKVSLLDISSEKGNLILIDEYLKIL